MNRKPQPKNLNWRDNTAVWEWNEKYKEWQVYAEIENAKSICPCRNCRKPMQALGGPAWNLKYSTH